MPLLLLVAERRRLTFSSPQIVHGQESSAMEKLAARELWRCLARVSGKPGTIATDDGLTSDRAAIVLLDVAGNNRLAAEIEKREDIAVDLATLGEDGFRWKATQYQGKPVLLLAAAKPAGVMYGVYKLLEKLGFGFYLGGDAFPPTGSPLVIPDSLDEVHKPVFAIRGTLPWGNLLNAYWDLDDWKYYFDQLSKQGYNFVGLHQYSCPMGSAGRALVRLPVEWQAGLWDTHVEQSGWAGRGRPWIEDGTIWLRRRRLLRSRPVHTTCYARRNEPGGQDSPVAEDDCRSDDLRSHAGN